MHERLYANVDQIVLDGGPNGGKSSGMSCIASFLNAAGYPVVSTPEAASEILVRGITPQSLGDLFEFQCIIMQRILDNERLFGQVAQKQALASPKKKAFLLCDRGLMSVGAYLRSDKKFDMLLRHFDLSVEAARNQRYAQVVHLRSTACGLEDVYRQTRKNNPVRTENIQQARALDNRIIAMWEGHHDLVIIGNENNDFSHKMNIAIGAIARRVGLPSPINIERKFLIDAHTMCLPAGSVTAAIRQFYVRDNLYLREMRFNNGVTIYFKTVKSCAASERRFKSEEIVDRITFADILSENATRVVPVLEKERTFFVYNGQYFRIDRFLSTAKPLVIAEVQPTDMCDDIAFPTCVEVIKEVTNDPLYYNYFIAQSSAQKPLI